MKCLKPGTYRFSSFGNSTVILANVNDALSVADKNINIFLKDQELLKELSVIDVQDHEIALHYEDWKLAEVLKPGKYAFWNVLKKHDFIVVDTRNPEAIPDIDISSYTNPKLEKYLECHDIESYEKGLLYYDNVFQKILEPGRYYFWKGPVHVDLVKVDMRQQQIDVTEQEVMTEDKVNVKLNFVCQYRVVDPLKVVEVRSLEEQLNILVQMIVRDFVGILKLDDFLMKKQEIGLYVLKQLNEKGEDIGVEFVYAGLKDVILPSYIKEVLNTVVIAEKRALANNIARREEVASTKTLLNTAKLMEENQTLYRLKELEYLEKICDKIGNISLTGSGSLLEQLNTLLAKRISDPVDDPSAKN